MKTFIVMGILAMSSTAFAKENLKELQKKHRALKHAENKKWAAMREECQTKFPKGFDTKSPDYDALFQCNEEIQDRMTAFEEKMAAEMCEKIGVSCVEKAKTPEEPKSK